MILGIGHDICDIRRVERILQRSGPRFKARIFTPKEIAAAEASGRAAAFLALRFAAKEAVYKAFGRYDQAGMSWHQAEILSDKRAGAPSLTLYGQCKKTLDGATPAGFEPDIHLSLCDEYPYASAYVVLSMKPLGINPLHSNLSS